MTPTQGVIATITAKYDKSHAGKRIFVIGDNVLPWENNGDDLPVMILKHRGDHWFVEPVEEPSGDNLGWFNSGDTLDIDYNEHPVYVHDRQESIEHYEALSH